MIARLLCLLGLHDFQWPPHGRPWGLWQMIRVECARGCGARTEWTCLDDGPSSHWAQRHPEP